MYDYYYYLSRPGLNNKDVVANFADLLKENIFNWLTEFNFFGKNYLW